MAGLGIDEMHGVGSALEQPARPMVRFDRQPPAMRVLSHDEVPPGRTRLAQDRIGPWTHDTDAGPGLDTMLRAATERRSLVLSAKDHGRGIPPADLERVFEKFTRLSPGDGRPAGTGLGLAIARGVIEAMGGPIRAESPVRDGRGTRLVIELPLVDPSLARPPTVGQEQALAGAAPHPDRG